MAEVAACGGRKVVARLRARETLLREPAPTGTQAMAARESSR